MRNEEIKDFLLSRDVHELYHANTVLTSCTFFKEGGLLSRGVVEDNGLPQTSQQTDETDKLFDVFYDIFFDSVDIHERTHTPNKYGPVQFVYSTDVLNYLPEDSIRITLENPINWTIGMDDSEKYFQSMDQLEREFVKGRFNQHITVRHMMNPVPFTYLKRVVLDNPQIDNTRYFENAYGYMQGLINSFCPGVPLEIRNCEPGCMCRALYRSYAEGYFHYRYDF